MCVCVCVCAARFVFTRDGAALRTWEGYGDLLVLREIVGVFSGVSN